ncbi:VOC family protein [Rhizobium leguminosarum]|uniref:VOC family protein n=1 Tax=Rhizobium leguminosarum TaxID=384 RepID=UPI001FED6E0C|nr:VOC family protein [Rhizobium leguminosarum]
MTDFGKEPITKCFELSLLANGGSERAGGWLQEKFGPPYRRPRPQEGKAGGPGHVQDEEDHHRPS